MKVAEQAREKLNEIVTSVYNDASLNHLTPSAKNHRIAYRMKQVGFPTVHGANILDLAWRLGFTVIGDTIYPWDS